MKVFVINRKRLMIIVGCFVTIFLTGALTLQNNIFFAKDRKLPIYCVDKKKKLSVFHLTPLGEMSKLKHL